jgi:3-deoxy-manno-octulosonate cytidylyltransferase (CMP-KDO synthetase)
MGSSRFPGKSLEPLLGLPLVLHVYERCKLYQGFSDVIVATCDQEIMDAVEAHGGKAIMTADTHDRCTDRVEECVRNAYGDLGDEAVITMVQGDEVLVTPEMISAVNDAQQKTGNDVINLGSRLYNSEDQQSTDTVKIVAGLNGYALYLSRSVIPTATRDDAVPIYQQTGIMAFTWKFLKTFSSLPQTPLERSESVDMLRVVENSLPLKVVFTEIETLGVDTPNDLKNGEIRLREDATTAKYMDIPQ